MLDWNDEIRRSGPGPTPRERLLAAVLDHSPREIIVADRGGKILYSNAMAERLLAGDFVLARNGDGLDLGGAPWLQKAFAAATKPHAAAPSSVLVRRGGEPAYSFTLIPLEIAELPGDVLIVGQRLPLADPAIEARLIALFGLTPAEAEVGAAIAEGYGLPEIAARRGVRQSTVRAQLKGAARKLGCRRQAEVASAVRGIMPIMGYEKAEKAERNRN